MTSQPTYAAKLGRSTTKDNEMHSGTDSARYA